ncbi:type II toxin-antitoxin system Phd/YefM family antitoxin [Paraburkholderia pallida]|uniref:Antitoxin n=1 Tax=Paraburkholderia pallida TaxID=2547399 RepID=A0A4P7D886_9BURK|nr:type II toxin-antitoxin system prevent-host-death family antitoxin [Paraburkholderia pallida]QBR03360.1 type II toxin-antitoxin system Phd/YefM family antitoxin [Paraburkholderia pallida]
MPMVDIHEAQDHLSRLVDVAAGGGEIVIAKGGKPVARLVPMGTTRTSRRIGGLRGKVRMADDFDALLPCEVVDTFNGG